jgi:hypothetical protein
MKHPLRTRWFAAMLCVTLALALALTLAGPSSHFFLLTALLFLIAEQACAPLSIVQDAGGCQPLVILPAFSPRPPPTK